MNKTDKLAAYLLSIYWTGAGDAGSEEAVWNYLNTIPLNDKDALRNIEDGTASSQLIRERWRTLTDYFKSIAEIILNDIEKLK